MITRASKDLRKRASRAKAQVTVGKGQVSEGTVAEVKRILDSEEIVKIKFLRSSDPSKKDQMIAELANTTHSRLVETRGNSATLFRPLGATAGKIYKDKSGHGE